MKNIFSKKQGFTLIELLIVIAIIAILSAVIMASFAASRAKARDAKRVSDVAQLQLALEQFFSKNNRYPKADNGEDPIADLQQNLVPTYLSKIPKDPNGSDYVYAVKPDAFDYIIRATLEKPIREGLGGPNVQIYGYSCDPETVNYCMGPN